MSQFGLRYHLVSEQKPRIKFFHTEEDRDKEYGKIYKAGKKRSGRFHFLIKI